MGALDGKIAIITGAGSGIGRASALRFAAEGAKLVLGDKTEAVMDTAKMVKDAGGTAIALQIDAGVEADVEKLVATAKSEFGGLHIAFANAGVDLAGADKYLTHPVTLGAALGLVLGKEFFPQGLAHVRVLLQLVLHQLLRALAHHCSRLGQGLAQ